MPKHQTVVLTEPKKHSVLYKAATDDPDPVVTSIYIMKGHLPRPFPQRVTLTFEPAEA